MESAFVGGWSQKVKAGRSGTVEALAALEERGWPKSWVTMQRALLSSSVRVKKETRDVRKLTSGTLPSAESAHRILSPGQRRG